MDKSKWYLNSIFYQIYFPSFQDSNSDGVVDLEGIISRINVRSYYEKEYQLLVFFGKVG